MADFFFTPIHQATYSKTSQMWLIICRPGNTTESDRQAVGLKAKVACPGIMYNFTSLRPLIPFVFVKHTTNMKTVIRDGCLCGSLFLREC